MDFEFNDPVFLLEIAYNSGYKFQMWFEKFEKSGGNWEWKTADPRQNPLILGVDEIVSVVQLNVIEKTALTDEMKGI